MNKRELRRRMDIEEFLVRAIEQGRRLRSWTFLGGVRGIIDFAWVKADLTDLACAELATKVQAAMDQVLSEVGAP